MNGTQWVPTANVGDAPGNWAFKFEVSVPKDWNGGSIDIISDMTSYVARLEPWQKGSGVTVAYKTKGWITVTVPLSWFRATDPTLGEGAGAPLANIADLVSKSGNSGCIVYVHNYSKSATATGFYAAFDNFRVVKIK